MPASTHRLLLHCDIANARFTLAEEGVDARASFDSFEDAYLEAESRCIEQTSLTLYNDRGKVIAETIILPPSTELANRARPLPVVD